MRPETARQPALIAGVRVQHAVKSTHSGPQYQSFSGFSAYVGRSGFDPYAGALMEFDRPIPGPRRGRILIFELPPFRERAPFDSLMPNNRQLIHKVTLVNSKLNYINLKYILNYDDY
jgi:hypothetical protein